MEASKSEQTAYILWFSEFSNLTGESKISVHRNQRTVQSGHGDDRIKKIKQDAPKCVQQFPGIKVDNPTAEATVLLLPSPRSSSRGGWGCILVFYALREGNGQTRPVSVLQKHHLYLSHSVQDQPLPCFRRWPLLTWNTTFLLSFLLQIHLHTCLQSSF